MFSRGGATALFILAVVCGSTQAYSMGSAPTGSFSLELAPDQVTESERPALLKFLADATALLPPQLKNVIARKVTVRFTSDLDSTTQFQVPSCGPGDNPKSSEGRSGDQRGKKSLQVRGQVSVGFLENEWNIHELKLNAAMKSEILRGPELSTPYPCGHKTLYGLAMATLLHELSHIYDFSNYAVPERQKLLHDCGRVVEDKNSVQSRCAQVINKRRVISYLPTFMSVVDWDELSERRLNFSSLRSPDPYEYSSLEEEFAVNMEYFLLDSEFACRRPAEFEYLKSHFGFDPYPSRPCRVPTQVQLANDSLGQSAGDLVDLDPSRVYQIHFLFASEGPELMSNWGHAMFRIVMCNKSRKQVGPECLSDLGDQIVVSFRANVGDWSINAWDGLNGKYPSQMFLYRLYPEIINEYTLDEFRDLISLPLKFTDAEKTRFVERVLEQYWQYSGKYYFLSNNCATEALHMLKGVIRDGDFQKWDVLTPVGLYDRLGSAGYIDQSLLDNQGDAQKKSYSLPSEQSLYTGAFDRLKQVSPKDIPVDRFEDYVSKSDAADRLALYQKLMTLGPAKTKGLSNRFFILETYIYHQTGNAYMNAIMTKLQSDDSEMEQKMSNVLELSSQAMPWNHATGGYGIPLPADQSTSTSAATGTDAPSAQIKVLYNDVMTWARQNLAKPASELDAILANEKFFASEMKKAR